MDITNSDDLREKIHEIHNYMRNNGIGYGLTSLKVFNLFYGLMKIEDYGLNETIGLNNEKCKFSYLLKLVNEPNKNHDLISILNNETLDSIYKNENIELLIGYNIPLDLKPDVYNYLINEINSIKDIEKTSKEQLSGKIYEYFVGRDQSAISELGAYFTNRGIVDFILNKIKPKLKPDGTIPKMIDMFGGSGGFTIGYMDYLIKNKFEIDWKSQLDNIYHFDINEDVLKSARLELFCLSQGIFPNMNNVKRTNSFKEDFRDIGKFDIIMTNPPYGGDKISTSAKKEKRDKIIKYIDNQIYIFKNYIIQKIEKTENNKKIIEDIKKPRTDIDKIISLIKHIDIFDDDKNNIKRIQELYNQQYYLKKENKKEIENYKKLCVNVASCSDEIIRFAGKHKLTGTDKEACSLMLIMDLLEVNGTAVGVIKEGLFFDSSYMELRKVLLKNYNVKEIISVPQNQFENTSTKTSIIIFNNDGDIKTTNINFSELKVNLYEKDEFVEIIENDKIEIKLKYNKGDIINIEEIFIKSVSIDDILNNDTISLNPKDYNKVSIIPGEDFELIKIKDICEYQNGYAFKTNEYTNEGIPLITITNINLNNKIVLNETTQKYIIENDKYNKFELVINDLLITLTGKKPNLCKIAIKEDNIKSYLNQRVLLLRNFKLINEYYFLAIFKLYVNNYINQTLGNGSNQDNISSEDIINIKIPIPKTPELINKWVSQISKPYDMKQQKEIRLKELEEEINNKIKDIQKNHKCEEVKLGNICKFNYGTRITKKNNIIGNIPVYGGGDITFYTNKSNRKSNTLILSRYAMSKKCIRIIYDDFYLNDSGLSIDSININQNYINYLLISSYYQNYIYINCSTGSVQKNINMNLLKEIKLYIPKDKELIDNLKPIFNEIEELQKEIKELDEIYNNQLKELRKEAIVNGNGNDNYTDIISIDDDINNDEEIQEEIQEEIKSTKLQTLEELKEQCKTLGIKGYSKKKKDELIELIKNHK
jgi:restriction endonuclease S subunit